jgi:hypothetical protein
MCIVNNKTAAAATTTTTQQCSPATSFFFISGEPYIRKMRNVTATANEKLFIKCHVTGYPIKSISWYQGTYNFLKLNDIAK